MRTFTRITAALATLALGLSFAGGALADDTDIYLNPAVATGAEPLVMFTLDYRPNLTATVCGGTECDTLIAEGYLPATGPYNFFQLLRAALKKVLDPIGGVRVGFMLNHDDNCIGSPTSGPTKTGCSNGAYVLSGFNLMGAGTDDPDTFQTLGEDPAKVALFTKLAAIPDPGGSVSHSFQGKELYFELFRYLTGQDIYNGHLGYTSFGDTNASTNLDVYAPAYSWDTSIETGPKYKSPIQIAGDCAKTFVINMMFQVSNQEDDSDAAITASKASGGMGGISLSGSSNSFDTVIRYLKDADLGDGTYGTVANLGGVQNVTSYFIVDPTKLNTTTHGYASAGGTGVALPLSQDPDELINTLNSLFTSILSVSTTFVSPSVPVNVFNRTQVVNEVFLALFDPDENGYPFWNGNLKKLQVGKNATTNESELQDAAGANAIDIDGRIKRDSVTFWTDVPSLPAPVNDEVAGADGRSVPRGGAGQKIPGFIAGGPGAANTDPGARQLFAIDPSDVVDGLLPIDTTPATAALLWNEITGNWTPAASSGTYAGATTAEQTRAVNVLKFARGLDDDGVTTRPWLLGDPLHSQPLAINYGARGGGYDANNPDIRLMMGTNDGYMHMFRNTTPSATEDGAESWAIIPREAVPVLDRLRTNAAGTPVHPTGTDGSPAAFTQDVNFDGSIISSDGDIAHVYFGLRRGGKAYYAFDVSDPDAPKLLWTLSKGAPGTDFAELGQTWSTPQVGSLKVGSTVKRVLVFAGGYNGDDESDDLGDLGKDAKNRSTRASTTPTPGVDDDEGNAIFIVDATNGDLIWKAVYGASAGYDTVRKAYLHPGMVDSFPAGVSAVDTNGDRLLDRIYAGDTGGVLWRIDLAGLFDHDSSTSTPNILVNDEPSVWQVSKLLSVGRHVGGFTTIVDDRRFFNRPDVVQSRDNVGPFDGVLIGSGDREDPNGTDVNNYFYLIKDRAITSGLPTPITLEHGHITDLTSNCLQDSSCTVAPNLNNGWRIALGASGEKSLASPITAAGSVFFSTFSPTPPSGTCSLSEGTGRLYVVALQDATAVFNFDTTNDIGGTAVLDRVDLLASGGIPVAVVPLGAGELLIQGQEAGQNIVNAGGQMSFKTYWHEIFQ
jgi:type IV pilus assembly protein PilY1